MNFCIKEYLTKIFNLSEDKEGIEMKFKDENLEENYIESILLKEKIKSKVFLIFCCLVYMSSVGSSLYVNKLSFNYTTYILIFSWISEIVLAIFTKLNEAQYVRIQILKYIRFSILYLGLIVALMLPEHNPDPSSPNYIRYIYCFLFIINVLYSYYLDYNVVILLIIPLINSGFILYCQFVFNFKEYYFAPEFIGNFVYFIVNYVIKKYDFSEKKEIFLEHYKNHIYTEFIKQLIDVLKTMVISVKKDEVLFMNNFAIKFFEKKNETSVVEHTMENDILNKKKSEISNSINPFFKSLILKTPMMTELTNLKDIVEGKSFYDISLQILSETNLTSKCFNRIGYFTTISDKDCFDIYFRKLKFKETEVMEILIHDITEVKQAEKINSETKFKQRILAKIAHEFKTPLITIISLINKINDIKCKIDLDKGVEEYLNHISNLSNYTLVLISDIIQYASNSIQLKLSKTQINLREVLDFNYNVLKTLVECNDSKVNRIETSLIVDEEIEKVVIISDENRFKQIILNLISNAYKFTKCGFIKIEAKYIKNSNVVEISVEDTGMGIKEVDYHLIFEENTQLNLEEEYRSKGSGLGLSITKTMAQALNHEIKFISKYGEGSKFSLLIECSPIKKEIKSSSIKISHIKPKISNKTISNLKSKFNNLDNDSHQILQKISSCKNIHQMKIDQLSQMMRTPKLQNLEMFKGVELDEYLRLQSSDRENSNSGISIRIMKSIEKMSKIVVVDDHKIIRENTISLINGVLSVLEINDIEILEAFDGIELLNILINDKNHQIKYIFLDETMEYLNGSDTVRIIRKMEADNKIKNYFIVSITAFDDTETKNFLLKTGVNLIISKPCTKSDISSILNNK